MAYIRFQALLDSNGESQYEAEWYTDADAAEYLDGTEPAILNMYHLELTDQQVQERNDVAASFWSFVADDHEAVGSPEIE